LSAVLALSRMRFAGYARSQRALAPVLATLAALAIVHGGGGESPADVYGFSAITLFGILGWQAKLSVDTEPDAQRQLSFLAVGSARRDMLAGILAAGATALPTIVIGLVAPWLAGAIRPLDSSGSVLGAVLFGVWVHLLAAISGVAVGVCASRPVTRARGWGVSTLVGASVLVLVLGLADVGPVRWLVPQLVGAIRAGERGDVTAGVIITVHALVWSAVVFGGYVVLRSRRR
jgi:hypothetical protein